MKTRVHCWSHFAQFLLEWEMFHTKVVEKINTHFMFSNPPPPENLAVCEIMWKNIVEPGSPQMTWCMRITCWIPMATSTQLEYVIRTFCFPHRSSCCTNALQCYVIRTLPAFLMGRAAAGYVFFCSRALRFYPAKCVPPAVHFHPSSRSTTRQWNLPPPRIVIKQNWKTCNRLPKVGLLFYGLRQRDQDTGLAVTVRIVLLRWNPMLVSLVSGRTSESSDRPSLGAGDPNWGNTR